ncbi:MAG: hypothetical protein M1814_003075 [Vezdaea aestivalis]|nr:MAG: hypothetical protein M1814_003075 [Vezdaea aestivalis]
MLETELLNCRVALLPDSSWKQFHLSKATICASNDPTHKFKDFLSVNTGEVVDIHGQITLSGKKKKLSSLKSVSNAQITLQNVTQYSLEEFTDGEVAIWAAGKTGWFLIKPAEAYQETHDFDLEAAKLYFTTVDYDEKHVPSSGGIVMNKLFKQCVEREGLSCTTLAEAENLFHAHHAFLIAHAVKEYYVRLQDPESSFSQCETYLTKWFRRHHPDELIRIHDQYIKRLSISPQLKVRDSPVDRSDSRSSQAKSSADSLRSTPSIFTRSAAANNLHGKGNLSLAPDLREADFSLDTEESAFAVAGMAPAPFSSHLMSTRRTSSSTSAATSPTGSNHELPAVGIASSEYFSPEDDDEFEVFRSRGAVDTIFVEFDRIRRECSGKLIPSNLSLDNFVRNTRKIEYRDRLTANPRLISAIIMGNVTGLLGTLSLETKLGNYNWEATRLFRELGTKAPPSSEHSDSEEGPFKRRRLEGTSAQLRPTGSASEFAGKAAMRSNHLSRGSPRGRPRGSRARDTLPGRLGRSSPTTPPPQGSPNRGRGRPRGSPGRPRDTPGRPRGSGKSNLALPFLYPEDPDEDLASSFPLNITQSTSSEDVSMASPVDSDTSNDDEFEGFTGKHSGKSDADAIGIVSRQLPTYTPQGPDDLWTCPLDGCLQRVRNASMPKGIETINEHYRKHAQKEELDNKTFSIVFSEAREALPVQNLLNKIRSMGSQDR